MAAAALPNFEGLHALLPVKAALLIEDDRFAMLLVREALRKHDGEKFHFTWTVSLTDGLEQLTKNDVDIVLLDPGLTDSSGAATYTRVRSACPRLPIVVLTGDMCEKTELFVLACGAEDYLVKAQTFGWNFNGPESRGRR